MDIFRIPKKGNAGALRTFSYSPGYSDMRGAYHQDKIEKNDNGEWEFVSSNRDMHSSPMMLTTYRVSADAVAEFESFIKEKNLIDLSNRPDSDMFVYDYSPRSYGIVFDCSAVGGSRYESYGFSQYKVFSDDDDALLRQVIEMFYALRGEKISESESDNSW